MADSHPYHGKTMDPTQLSISVIDGAGARSGAHHAQDKIKDATSAFLAGSEGEDPRETASSRVGLLLLLILLSLLLL